MSHLKRIVSVAALWIVLILSAQAEKVTYIYTDPQGTPLAEADASGNVTATFDYRPFGLQELGSPIPGPGYTGHITDADIGLVYMQARYYDPLMGRFISVDPAPSEAEGDLNRYAYGRNNPVRFTDPDGRQAVDAADPVKFSQRTSPTALMMLFCMCDPDYRAPPGSGEVQSVSTPFEGLLAGGMVRGGRLTMRGIGLLRAGGAGIAEQAATRVEIPGGKFDYLFGRVASNTHNAGRSNQLAHVMKRLGVPDTAAGRQLLADHLTSAVNAEGNVTRTFSNQFGNFEVRESLFMGPSGKAAKFESTFKVLDDGTRRLTTIIPYN